MTIGKCHICKYIRPIELCKVCDHWFCKLCRKDIKVRLLSALDQYLNGRKEGCCGPNKE